MKRHIEGFCFAEPHFERPRASCAAMKASSPPKLRHGASALAGWMHPVAILGPPGVCKHRGWRFRHSLSPLIRPLAAPANGSMNHNKGAHKAGTQSGTGGSHGRAEMTMLPAVPPGIFLCPKCLHGSGIWQIEREVNRSRQIGRQSTRKG
jgi:hypothetical protein